MGKAAIFSHVKNVQAAACVIVAPAQPEVSRSTLFRTLAAAPLALAVSLLTAAPAQASVIYTYTGNLFSQFSNSGPRPRPSAPTPPATA